MKTILLTTLALLATLALSSQGFAQTNDMQGKDMQGNTQGKDVQGQLSSRDYKFAKAAALGGNMEVTLGQIAAQNSQDSSVRDFGNKMVQDHQAANQQLTQLLSQKGASVATAPGWMDEKMVDHLRNLKGTDFDRAYMKHMVSDHKDDIKEFQKEASNGDDNDLKNFASKTLPTLQEHLRLAQDIQAKLSSSASK